MMRTLSIALFLPLLLAYLPVYQAFGQSSKDLRDLNSHCPFTPPSSLEAWLARVEPLRLQLQVSLGLLPRPELDPVQPKIYGRVEREDYTIEKVTFESLPGFYVTGNLYRPKDSSVDAKVPAVLCPHGHWSDARFYEASPGEVKKLLATGAERFENAARNHIQARCVQLARMGCIVFHWDMIGYCDNQQISFDRAHKFSGQNVESEVTDAGWLLFSPLAESHCQSVLGLQSLAIERAVDMLLSLPEVDPKRIAITGASGGGTQSFLGAALDERISVAFPAVMVSTGMQGGCTCENASLLRTGTGNVEMAALIAPRPLGLTAADDWTKTMPQDGFPELQKLYGLFNAPKNVALFPAVHFGHNFNHVSRVGMYGWINDHFQLGQEKPILERQFELALRDELQVWDEEHPAPEGGIEFERKLMKLWAEVIDSQLHGLLKGDQHQVQQLAKILTAGWRASLCLTGTTLPAAEATWSNGNLALQSEQLPTWQLLATLPTFEKPSTTANAKKEKAGKEDLQKQAANSAVTHDAVTQIAGPAENDLYVTLAAENGQIQTFYPVLAGVSLTDGGREEVYLQAIVPNPRLAAAYTFGYNPPLFAQRAQQIGVTLVWLSQQHPEQKITIFAQGANAALAAAGAFVAQELAKASNAPPPLVNLKLEPGDFSFANVKSIRDPNFLPGSARYWDLPGLLASLNSNVNIDESNVKNIELLQALRAE